MTALNLAIAADRSRALIVTDSLVTGTDGGMTTKCVAVPHLQLVLAAEGQLFMLQELLRALLAGSPARDLEDVEPEIPPLLRRLWDGGAPSSLLLAGADRRDEIVAAAFSWRADFEPQRLAVGAYLSPGLEAETAADPATPEVAPRFGWPVDPPPLRLTWAEQDRALLDYLPLQQREHPHAIGGRIQRTLITPYSIYQHWLGVLGEAAP